MLIFLRSLNVYLRRYAAKQLSAQVFPMSSEIKKPVTSDTNQPAKGSWSLNYVTGDLFSCPKDEALAHCISEDCRMGAGIAVIFKKKFSGVEELKDQKKLMGQCAVLKRDERFVYYLITKKKASQKPTYDSLEQSLKDMRSHCVDNGVTRISMPRIGCGLDRLSWEKVSETLEHVFKHTDISITIYSIPEKAETTVRCKPAKGSWKLNYVTGDLFSCPKDEALAHCISEDCRMGAGIAVVFKRKFAGVEELKDQKKLMGQCAVLKRDERLVYYLITKKRANHQPTYDSLKQSLEDMRSHCVENGVTRISMPRIGCGLDRLSWEKVSETLEHVFKHTDISITIYSIPEKAETTVMRENMRR